MGSPNYYGMFGPGLSILNTLADSEGATSVACHLNALLTAEWWLFSWREIWSAHLLGITSATINRKLIENHSNEQIFQEQKTHTSKWQHFAIYQLQISVVNQVHQIIFWEHTLLCFQPNYILKNSDDQEILYKQFGFKSCLAMEQKQKKEAIRFIFSDLSIRICNTFQE